MLRCDWRLVLAASLLASSLAGCADPATTPAVQPDLPTDLVVDATDGGGELGFAVAQVANVTLQQGTGMTLRLGTGWGQLRIRTTDGGLDVDVENDRFESFDAFSDREGDDYVPGIFTVVRLDGAMEPDDFWWLGRDSGFSGPLGPSLRADPSRLEQTADEDGIILLTVATSFPDYVLRIGGSGPTADWALGPHPHLVADWPEPEVVRGADAGVAHAAYQRHWLVEMPGLPAAGIYAYAWSSNFGQTPAGGARGGVASTTLDITPMGDDPGPQVSYFPSGGFGGYFGGGSYRTATTAEVADMQVSRWHDQTDAGVATSTAGLGVVAVPLVPPG